MKSIFKRFAGLGLLLFAGSAAAQSSCESILSSYFSDPVTYAYYLDYHPECFAGGSTTSTTTINATSFSQAGAISQALASRSRQSGRGPVAVLPGQTGIAAGGSLDKWNFWASHNSIDSSVRVNNGVGRNDNDVDTTIIGADYAVTAIMTAGISAAIDRTDGSNLAGLKSHNHGVTIAPYLAYQLTKDWALDLSAGLGRGEFSSGTSRADADRWFATANLSYSQWMGNVQLTGRASYLHGEEEYGDTKNNGAAVANSATKNRLDQFRLGARAAYWMDGVMPYFGVTYATDMRRSSSLPVAVDPLGRDAFVLSIGADFFSLSSKITGGISYEQEHGRRNSKNETFMANINFRF